MSALVASGLGLRNGGSHEPHSRRHGLAIRFCGTPKAGFQQCLKSRRSVLARCLSLRDAGDVGGRFGRRETVLLGVVFGES